MANSQHLQLFLQSCAKNNCNTEWNSWRKQNPKEKIDLSSTNFSDCNLSFANLSGAKLTNCYFRKAILDDCKLFKSSFCGSYIVSSSFDQANLKKASFANSYVLNCQFYKANLHHTNFASADVRGSLFDEEHKKQAIFPINNKPKDAQFTTVNKQQKEKLEVLTDNTIDFLEKPDNEFIVKEETSFSYQEQKPYNKKSLPPRKICLFVFLVMTICIGIYFRQLIFFKVLSFRLHHSNIEVRYNAVSSLKMASREIQCNPRVMKILISKIDENVPKVRTKVHKVLNMIGRPALGLLLNTLSFGSKSQKIGALQVIKNMGEEGIAALPIVCELLQDEDVHIRIQATKTVYSFGRLSRDLVPLFLENIAVENNELRAVTIQCLSRTELFNLVRYRLVKYLNSEDDLVCGETVLAVSSSEFLKKETMKMLSERLVKSKNVQLKCRILFCFGSLARRMDIQDVVDAILSCVYDKNPKVVFYAVQTLGHAKQLEIIHSLLSYKDDRIRELATNTMEMFGQKERQKVVDTLLRIMPKETNTSTLQAQLTVLSKIGRSLAYEKHVLSIFTNSENVKARSSCLLCLGYVGVSNHLLDLLFQLVISDEFPQIRIAAAQAITCMNKPHAVTKQIKTIWKTGRSSQILLLDVLQKTSLTNDVIPLLLSLAEDKDFKVRRRVLGLLKNANTKDYPLDGIVMKHLQDEHLSIRRQATSLVRHLKIKRTKEIKQILKRQLFHEDNKLRLYSLEALIEFGDYDREVFDHLKNDTYHQIRNLIKKTNERIEIENVEK